MFGTEVQHRAAVFLYLLVFEEVRHMTRLDVVAEIYRYILKDNPSWDM